MERLVLPFLKGSDLDLSGCQVDWCFWLVVVGCHIGQDF